MKEWRDRKNFWSLKNEFLFKSRPKPKKNEIEPKILWPNPKKGP